MPNTITTPNMGLVLPVVLTDPGPDWATRIFNALNVGGVDSHDHSSGKGLLVTPAGLNINADLAFGGNNGTALRSTRYAAQGGTLALGTDVACLYNFGGNLYWNAAGPTPVQITNGNQVQAPFTGFPTQSISGTFTIPNGSTTTEFLTAAGTTVNLPAASTQAAGRMIVLDDYLGGSNASPTAVVPNGADTINGVNANYFLQHNFGKLILVTDAAGHWAATLVASGEYLDIPVSVTTSSTSATTILAFQTVNNTSYYVHFEFVAKQTAANVLTQQLYSAWTNNAGTVSKADNIVSAAGTIGSNPGGATAAQSTVSGTQVLLQVIAAAATSTSWKGTVRIIPN